ncbi:hypothetical protein SAMN05444920_111274 [Nonomuraea solani]|uniref:Uncharacterized protein n=1 Tax=Nonomuraea solani TaxID=1144553 RepID=A0A1H6EMH9_9ACTN|nr:hypothetical protein [Nonomuraea solani]SEG98291.1 hypothetical protein SAMN05444920_111274 [Nonomuraea solani]
MRHAGAGEHIERVLAAARACWGAGPGGDRCVVAEAFDEDLRVVVRTLAVARAVCGLLSARLVVPGRPEWRRLAEAFGAADDVWPEVPPVALVASRVDRTLPREIPVVYVHGTGSLKAYALFPDQGPCSLEEELPARVGAFFERHVWPYRETIRPSAERAAWRAKSGYQLRTETERRQLRYYGCARLGLDADRPTIAVFGHVPARDAELFGTTAEFAMSDESANWLFLDRVPADGRPRIRNVTGALSANLLWSMADVAVTFGDSDLPAFGIPVIQAGWSEGGVCGAAHVPRSPHEHRGLLQEAIARHAKGESILGPEQRERARLWLWLRRCGADVPSQLLPHWEHGADYARTLAVNLRHAEPDGDPLYGAVARMWERRDPVLTRFDLHDPAGLAGTLTPSRSFR